MTKPAVLTLCTHTAGRSQMALGFFKHLAGEQASVYSGGSEPARAVNPAAIAAMAERGIDITTEQPKRWTPDMLESADVLITMGCGDTRPVLPGRRQEEWALPDPAGLTVGDVRSIRDAIDERVLLLLEKVGVDPSDTEVSPTWLTHARPARSRAAQIYASSTTKRGIAIAAPRRPSDADWTASVRDQPTQYPIVSEPISPQSYPPPDVHVCAKGDASCPHLV